MEVVWNFTTHLRAIVLRHRFLEKNAKEVYIFVAFRLKNHSFLRSRRLGDGKFSTFNSLAASGSDGAFLLSDERIHVFEKYVVDPSQGIIRGKFV